jgi:hypothetical protein
VRTSLIRSSSIFFITTYFSDYVLVPLKARGQVIRALEDRGFVFGKSAEAFVKVAAHHRNASSASSLELNLQPSSPPPATFGELQLRTFALLKHRGIVLRVHRDIRLVHCGGGNGSDSTSALYLQAGLVKCLAYPPYFLSVTLTRTEPASVLLEKTKVSHFGPPGVLLGNMEALLVPITLDLQSLPLESTGIVCGVAGKLVGGPGAESAGWVEMSYLSTAKAGAVMVEEQDLEKAIEALSEGEHGLDVV